MTRRNLFPFISYFGAKVTMSRVLPEPRYGGIDEVFAGSAAYSTRWYDRPVRLYDASPVIRGIWEYLIRTPAEEILRLPLLEPGESIENYPIPQEAKWLIGFWVRFSVAAPCKQLSYDAIKKPNRFWGAAIRQTIASQVDCIRHWRVVGDHYNLAPGADSTWLIDPPYWGAPGEYYQYNTVDYDDLRRWVRSRHGLVLVHECERAIEGWLPELRVVGYLHAVNITDKYERRDDAISNKSPEAMVARDTYSGEDFCRGIAEALAKPVVRKHFREKEKGMKLGGVVVRQRLAIDDDEEFGTGARDGDWD